MMDAVDVLNERIAQLEAENARLTALLADAQKALIVQREAREERDALATRCRELEPDKDRVDWLDDNATTLWSVYGEIALGDDIREELDAAIKGGKP